MEPLTATAQAITTTEAVVAAGGFGARVKAMESVSVCVCVCICVSVCLCYVVCVHLMNSRADTYVPSKDGVTTHIRTFLILEPVQDHRYEIMTLQH